METLSDRQSPNQSQNRDRRRFVHYRWAHQSWVHQSTGRSPTVQKFCNSKNSRISHYLKVAINGEWNIDEPL
ncbi:MAG: hypothetical protein ACFCBU_13250 [Cyanophyceae cyanobacterium]